MQPESGDPEEEVSGTETETEGDGEQKDNLVAEQPDYVRRAADLI